MSLQRKNALVIGGAVGIGRAVCDAFASEGANVVLADRGWPEEKRAALQSMQALGVKALSVEVDVTVEATIVEAIETSIRQLGHIDILVNNAGVTSPGAPLYQQDWRIWDDVFDVNLKGVAFGMKHVLPHMMWRGYGRIINTSSQLAHKPTGNHGGYCASKAAVVTLSASVALEVAAYGITVNCVCPGMTRTAMLSVGGSEFVQERLKALPIGRGAEPAEIAGAYVYLASESASFVIGQSLSPNGGDGMW